MIDQLFGSKTRVKLLELFYSNPNRSFYVREITRKIDEQINSVRRELAGRALAAIEGCEDDAAAPMRARLSQIAAVTVEAGRTSGKLSRRGQLRFRLPSVGEPTTATPRICRGAWAVSPNMHATTQLSFRR